ncbi:WW domain binding protein 11, partial [Cunninghamella echinulata]
MGKAKRGINPADALRKMQRKRELKKNKEIRKSAREAGLAKKDTSKILQDIARLESLGKNKI